MTINYSSSKKEKEAYRVHIQKYDNDKLLYMFQDEVERYGKEYAGDVDYSYFDDTMLMFLKEEIRNRLNKI